MTLPHTNADSAAHPTLGSALLTLAQSQYQTSLHLPATTIATASTSTIPSPLSHSLSINHSLFPPASISSLAGDRETGKSLVALHSLASFLLESSPRICGYGRRGKRGHSGIEGIGDVEDKRVVAVVDTTGGFSVGRLRDVLLLHVRMRAGGRGRHGRFKGGGLGEVEGEEEVVMGLLDRVKLMRVFDLAGLLEVVGEVGEMRERARERGAREAMRGLSEEGGFRRRVEVGDSEEDEDDDDGDDEMLGGEAEESAEVDGGDEASGKDCVGMIIIDTITNVASSAVSKSPVQGQALLASFMQSLQHLTARYQICTILINSAVGMNPSVNPEYRHRRADDHVSAFASSIGRPALGKAFANCIDTSFFLTLLPKRREDAITAYGNIAEGRAWQKAIVLEVLKDRYGTREGQWAAFEIEGPVKLVPYSS